MSLEKAFEDTLPEEDDIEIVFDDEGDDDAPGAGDDQDGDDADDLSADTDDDEDDEDADPDLPNYGKRAQKRIKGLLAKQRVLNQRLEELERVAQDAEVRARRNSTAAESSNMRSLEAAESQLKAEKVSLQQAWSDAYDEGDKKKLIELQEKIAENVAKAQHISQWKEYYKSKTGTGKRGESEALDREEPTRRDPAAEIRRKPDPRAVKWQKANADWFNKDRVKTVAALTIHQELIEEGYDPADKLDEDVGEEAYYKELDARMAKQFPDLRKGKETKPGMSKQRVAGGASGGSARKGGKTVVKLTRGERERADALGVSYKDYAKQKELRDKRKERDR